MKYLVFAISELIEILFDYLIITYLGYFTEIEYIIIISYSFKIF